MRMVAAWIIAEPGFNTSLLIIDLYPVPSSMLLLVLECLWNRKFSFLLQRSESCFPVSLLLKTSDLSGSTFPLHGRE